VRSVDCGGEWWSRRRRARWSLRGARGAELTDAVAAAAVRLLSDPALRARLGHDGRALVERHLNWDRAAAEITRIANMVTGALLQPAHFSASEATFVVAQERPSGGPA
jgi:hypothetical protein